MAVNINSSIDMAIELFWKEPGTRQIEGASTQLQFAKYYLLGRGISAEDFELYVDQIKSKLAGLADKERNKPPTPPASLRVSNTPYEGPLPNFGTISLWTKNRDDAEQAGCSFSDEAEHRIADNYIEFLDAPVIDGEYLLLKWSPHKQAKTYRQLFRVVPTKLLSADVVFGKDWWEEKKTSNNTEKGKKKNGKSEKSANASRKRRSSDKKSECSTSTKKSRDKRRHRESDEQERLNKIAVALLHATTAHNKSKEESEDSSDEEGDSESDGED